MSWTATARLGGEIKDVQFINTTHDWAVGKDDYQCTVSFDIASSTISM